MLEQSPKNKRDEEEEHPVLLRGEIDELLLHYSSRMLSSRQIACPALREGICREKCKYNDCVAEVSAAIELLLCHSLVRLGSICSCFY